MRHPNKHIAAALRILVAAGWRVEKAGKSSHAWGRIYCPCGTCAPASVWSTPRNPQSHARRLLLLQGRCPGKRGDDPDASAWSVTITTNRQEPKMSTMRIENGDLVVQLPRRGMSIEDAENKVWSAMQTLGVDILLRCGDNVLTLTMDVPKDPKAMMADLARIVA